MNFFNKSTNWLGHQGSKLFIPTRNPLVQIAEKESWYDIGRSGIDVLFALKDKNINQVLLSVNEIIKAGGQHSTLSQLCRFIDHHKELKIEDIKEVGGANTYTIYNDDGEWYRLKCLTTNTWLINIYYKDDVLVLNEVKESLGSCLTVLDKYLTEKETEKLIDENEYDDEDNYDDWMKKEGIVGWCKRRAGVAVKLAKYHQEYTGDFPDYIIILNKQYVYKLKSNQENNLLYLMPHSKQEDLVKVGAEEDIIDYLEEKLQKAISN